MPRDIPPKVPISDAPQSAASFWAPLARAIGWERRLGDRMARSRAGAFAYEFFRFGVKQAWACLFGGVIVALMVVTHLLYPSDAPLPRYDFLFLAALATQILLLRFRMETWEEAKVIFLYHLIGTVMEIFKTSVGSWIYPAPAFFHVGHVPLFSGFMYASIGSYLARAWRLFDFRFTRHPPLWALGILSAAIYTNFFTHHYIPDLRLILFVAAGILFRRTRIHYRVWRRYRSMPLLLGLTLVTLFIWFAENIGTFSEIWLYPHQRESWAMVRLAKLGSWFLLLIISYSLVAAVNGPAPFAEIEEDKAAKPAILEARA